MASEESKPFTTDKFIELVNSGTGASIAAHFLVMAALVMVALAGEAALDSGDRVPVAYENGTVLWSAVTAGQIKVIGARRRAHLP